MLLEIMLVVFILYVLQVQHRMHHEFEVTVGQQLPSTWETSIEKKLKYTVCSVTDEFTSISNEFLQAMGVLCKQIVKIERIQNERCFLQYLAHRREFEQRLGINTEIYLYHGCPQEAAQCIINSSFNRSFAGVNGTVYGVGVYFSSNPAYSHNFATPNSNGERHMFKSRVLKGNHIVGNSTMRTPPIGFDTTTDGKHITVIYHDAQVYAEYLITYK